MRLPKFHFSCPEVADASRRTERIQVITVFERASLDALVPCEIQKEMPVDGRPARGAWV
jgi:hypothetical protein